MNEQQTEQKSAPSRSAFGPAEPGQRLLHYLAMHFSAGIAAMALWAATDAWQQTSQLKMAVFLSIAMAAIAAVVVSTMLHEWGHYLGARICGSIHSIPDRLGLFVFGFDFSRNDLRQFLWMSWGGQAGSWLAIVLLWLAIPMDTAGRSMLVCAAIGSAVFTATVEWPVIMRSRTSANPLQALQLLNRARFYRCGQIGAIVALLLWLIVG